MAQERGLDSIDAHHRDEELNPPLILDNIKHYFDKDWCNMTWYALPKHGSFFCLGNTTQITYWDPNREWLRPKPEWAETLNDRTEVLGRHGYDGIVADRYPKGKVAIINGIRAEESLVRYRSVVNKIHDNYIVGSSLDHVRLAKPIYDWMENDVFKYFYDNDLRYSAWYEQQLWSGDGLRVAPPLIAESMKTIDKWAQMDPDFYNRLTEIFPEVRAHERYKGTISNKHIYEDYGKEMLRIQDRHDRDMLYGPTNEELITEIFAASVRSASTLPRSLTSMSARDPIPRPGSFMVMASTILKLSAPDAFSCS